MSRYKASWLAWLFWVFGLLLSILTLAFHLVNERSTTAISAFSMLGELTFLTVGLLIVSRRSGNLIGWLFLIGPLVEVSGELVLEYAVFTLVTAPAKLPGGDWAAWFGNLARGIGFFLEVPFVLLLFPDGRLPSARWRIPAILSVCSLAAFMLSMVLTTTATDLRLPTVPNPLRMNFSPGFSNFLDILGLLGVVVSMTIGVAAVLYRFRISKGDERQQIKWLAYIAVLDIIIITGIVVTTITESNTNYAVSTFLFSVINASIPLAVGIAILKYRLYDIDILIRRTLVYGALTATLAVLFFGSVFLLQQLIERITGTQNSPVAVVISTLAIAALFTPLRSRIQRDIDRRFYRRKYDAQQTLESFAATVRDEVELEAISAHLLAVVQETMQPEYVSLWLKPASGRSLGANQAAGMEGSPG